MGRRDRETRLREEFALHLEMATEANIRRGMSPDEARRAARLAFGASEHFKDEARDQLRNRWLAATLADARYAARAATRAPLLTGVVILTLATAIALATSAFTVIDGALFRALPYPHPDHLALVWATAPGSSDERQPVSFTNAMDWRRDTKAFASLATFSCTARPILETHQTPARASMMEVSLDFFRVLEARPLMGRLFDSTDVAASTDAVPNVIVLTYDLWRHRFGADPSVVGSRVLLDDSPVTVAGVLPPEFAPLPTSLACRPEIYRPLAARYDDAQRSWSYLRAIARLAPAATIEQAQAELDVENARLARAHPESNRGVGAHVGLLGASLTSSLRPLLSYAQLGALLVLLVACADVASLLLARATARRRELSIRAAMGAPRTRIARQIATECLMLGAVSGLVALLLAAAGTRALNGLARDALPDPRGLALDWRVVAFAVAVSLLATVTFGFVAMLRSQGNATWLMTSLRDGGRTASPTRTRLGRAIVTAQLATAMVVLLGASLLVRSYRKLHHVNPGFDPSGLITARITLPDATYPRGARQVAFFRQVLARISAQPGVIAAGATSILPDGGNFDRTRATVVGKQYAPNEAPTPDVYRVTPGYFAAMRIPLRAGRQFTEMDDDRHPLVAVINQSMARAMFSDGSAIGRRIWSGAGNAERTIVGVVGDVYQYGLDSAKTMQLYVPHADNSGGDLTLVVRSSGTPASLPLIVRSAVHAVAAGVPVDDIMTMDHVLAVSASQRRLLARLSLIFALAAVGLAAVGLYGVIAYSVGQRTREIGLRMALGATPRSIAWLVSRDMWPLVAGGILAGLLVAGTLARLVAPLLFGVRVTDQLSLVLAPIALAGVALCACAGPTLRAARVDPSVALRDD